MGRKTPFKEAPISRKIIQIKVQQKISAEEDGEGFAAVRRSTAVLLCGEQQKKTNIMLPVKAQDEELELTWTGLTDEAEAKVFCFDLGNIIFIFIHRMTKI
uniref:Uncharacterized protein n=1 Tax=Ditylenchus dipsaci TaxID=166011 RepID=A0A915CYG5_9BILA